MLQKIFYRQTQLPKFLLSTINISKLNIDIYEIDQRSITEVNYLFKNLSTYDIKYSLPFYGKKVVSNKIEISKTLNNEKKFNIDLNKYLKKSVNGVFVAILSDQKMHTSMPQNGS